VAIKVKQSYIQLQGVIFVHGNVDHREFITRFYAMLDKEGYFFQGKSRKITEEDLDGREKRD
jgi:hypothetical protein